MTNEKSKKIVRGYKIVLLVVIVGHTGLAYYNVGRPWFWLYVFFSLYFVYRLYSINKLEQEAYEMGMNVHDLIEHKKKRNQF